MTVVMKAFTSMFWPSWAEWVRRELAPYPGRDTMTIRLMVTVVLVIIISMTLQVPFLVYSGFVVFFVTKEHRVLTMFVGSIAILGNTIACLVALSLYNYTFDYPELRIPIMTGLVFAGMFLSRVFVIGPLGFAIGFFTALMLVLTERAHDPDALV